MKIVHLFPVLLLAALVSVSCNKDKEEKEPEPDPNDYTIKYDGKSFTITAGREWRYQTNRYPTHNTFAYFMGNGTAFIQSGNYDLGPNDPPITLFYYLSLPASSGYMQGIFEYYNLPDNWYTTGLPASVHTKQIMTDAVVGYDENGDRKITPDEVIRVTGGTINYNGGESLYDLTLANGKTVKGRIKATVGSQLPPS